MARLLQRVPGLSLLDRYKFCLAPVNVREVLVAKVRRRAVAPLAIVRVLAGGGDVPARLPCVRSSLGVLTAAGSFRLRLNVRETPWRRRCYCCRYANAALTSCRYCVFLLRRPC